MRVGLLTQWYDPEPGPAALPGVLARGLHDRGHEVQVLTGFPNYPDGQVAAGYRVRRRLDERRDEVAVRRVALYPSHDASAVRRFATYASFGGAATAFGLDALRGLDALWVNYSPITVAWPMWAARLRFGLPALVHVLDLWPDTILASGFGKPWWLHALSARALHAWCGAMYDAAGAVAYISPGVGDLLQKRGVPARKLAYIPMWADEHVLRPEAPDLRDELGIDADQVVLVYAGALGPAQGLETLIEACARVRDPRLVCLIAGSGIAESSLRSATERRGLTNVRFLGRMPPSEIPRLTATSDLQYVGLRPHALSGVTMPSKTQAILASGKAMLVVAEGDVARVAQESGAGFTASPDDVDSVASLLEEACGRGRDELRRLGARARAYYDRTFSAERGIDQVEALLVQVAERKVPA